MISISHAQTMQVTTARSRETRGWQLIGNWSLTRASAWGVKDVDDGQKQEDAWAVCVSEGRTASFQLLNSAFSSPETALQPKHWLPFLFLSSSFFSSLSPLVSIQFNVIRQGNGKWEFCRFVGHINRHTQTHSRALTPTYSVHKHRTDILGKSSWCAV